MNARLQSALKELKSAKAEGLPTEKQVLSAKDGSSWNGKKSNGDSWNLTKNNENSFTCMC
jgi:hypothetical protein